MKKIVNILIVIVLVITVCSCFFEDDTRIGKTDISKIELISEFDNLTFMAMDIPNFGVMVNQSGENHELSYEWAYARTE